MEFAYRWLGDTTLAEYRLPAAGQHGRKREGGAGRHFEIRHFEIRHVTQASITY